MYSRKQAFSMAKQYRRCPPPQVLKDPSQKVNLNRHFAVCPYCSKEKETDLFLWDELTARLREMAAPGPAGMKQTIAVEAGQLRYIRSDYARWREGYYYTPPCVLVLEIQSEVSDEITVAQTYWDIGLAGPGDLILTKKQTRFEDLFIECWNTYVLRAADMDHPIGHISDEALEAVKQMAHQTEFAPQWAVRPKPFSGENDIRLFFRELEVEVAFTFSSRAAASILHELSRPRLIYSYPKEVQNDIRKKYPATSWPADPPTVESALVVAQLPSEAYAMAAAVDDEYKIQVKLFALHMGRIASIDVVSGTLFHRKHTVEGIEFAGRIDKLPKEVSDSSLWCYLYSEKAGYVLPEKVAWDEEKLVFEMNFKTDEPAADLYVALIYDAEYL
ncbi:MAG: hypothetical protein JRK26_26840 [Deltaproteobacteria bacterium]|nr:hypothetical protein [Deltaproteobacteria bacterium]